MEKYIIKGGTPLYGEVDISGAEKCSIGFDCSSNYDR